MRFFFDEKKLQNHHCVYKVDQWKMLLKYDFRLRLYKAWKKEQQPAEVLRILREEGLTEELVGQDYFLSVTNGFKSGGYPVPHRAEIAAKIDYQEENPLILSGKYTRPWKGSGNGLVIEKSFLQEIENRYPEVSVEESIRMAGLDPVDVGYSRIRNIKVEIEKKKDLEYRKQLDDFMAQNKWDEEEHEAGNQEETATMPEPGTVSARLNPYVESIDYAGVQLKNAFYNEAYLLYPLGLEKILRIFELPSDQIPERSKVMISSKLHSWSRGDEQLSEDSEQIRRIRRSKVVELNQLVQTGFSSLGKGFSKMDIKNKRRFCQYLQELPRDTTGFYTSARIRELSGIPKSTYYALLNDDGYGKASEKKAGDDEADIEVIREVLSYKGFEKGIRQVYMLMPKVTGQKFSIYRIRRLMNKYGIRTTIRRPSRNRKAMKELIARNRKANLLMRRFRMHRPNEVRLTDVTYLDYGDELRAYGSASVDPVTGRLICFIVSENNDLQLALDTLEAMDEHPAESGAILHSDQGILYMTDDFQAAVIEKELTQSMSRRGNCWDNAPQESFFGHFKDECHYGNCRTLEELRSMISSYGVYYNTERGMWEKERMTPEEYEKYLESMDETQWREHLAREEERYLKMKAASAAKAVEDAKQYRNEIEERLGELRP